MWVSHYPVYQSYFLLRMCLFKPATVLLIHHVHICLLGCCLLITHKCFLKGTCQINFESLFFLPVFMTLVNHSINAADMLVIRSHTVFTSYRRAALNLSHHLAIMVSGHLGYLGHFFSAHLARRVGCTQTEVDTTVFSRVIQQTSFPVHSPEFFC